MKPTNEKHTRGLIIGLISVLAMIVIACGFYFAYKSMIVSRNMPGVQQHTTVEKTTADNITGKTGEATDLTNPVSYLPGAYMKYTYDSKYQDGTESKIEAVSGIFEKISIVSVVELIPDSEATTVHFIKGSDGVYSFIDEELNKNKSIWLINKMEKGGKWEDGSVEYTIVETDANYDLGFMKVKNCIVIEANYKDENMTDIEYIAPGFGVVLIKDKANGNIVMKLTAVAPIKKQDADKILRQYSPRAVEVSGEIK